MNRLTRSPFEHSVRKTSYKINTGAFRTLSSLLTFVSFFIPCSIAIWCTAFYFIKKMYMIMYP